MLPAYIIEEIRRRELEERSRDNRRQPQIELPQPVKKSEPNIEDKSDRGVVIIDLMGDT